MKIILESQTDTEVVLIIGYNFVAKQNITTLIDTKTYLHLIQQSIIHIYMKNNGYVVYGNAKYLHRYIYSYYFGDIDLKNKQIDHINGDKSDNRISNLRLVSNQQNQMNRKPSATIKVRNEDIRKDKYSQYKGVSATQTNDKITSYRAYIAIENKQIHLGCYDTEQEAAHAYNVKAKELFGEYALLNDVEPCELKPTEYPKNPETNERGVRKRVQSNGNVVYDVRIKKKGKEYHVGTFNSLNEAKIARANFVPSHE